VAWRGGGSSPFPQPPDRVDWGRVAALSPWAAPAEAKAEAETSTHQTEPQPDMRDGSFSRRGGGRYSKLATSEEEADSSPRGSHDHAKLKKLREAGSMKTYIDNLDNPDNEIFQRCFSTTIYVTLLWAGGFYYLFPDVRSYIIVGIVVCALVAYKISWM
jgi:hypothetical protein